LRKSRRLTVKVRDPYKDRGLLICRKSSKCPKQKFIFSEYLVGTLWAYRKERMNTNQKSKLLVDIALLVSLLAAYFLDLTGLSLHQWIGVAVGVVAAYHLLTHWNWVKAVSQRLFKRATSKVRLYYAIDAALLVSGLVVIGTGFVISTWLNLSLTHYDAWLTIHIASSIVVLGITVLKIGLHSRWVQEALQNAFGRPATQLRTPAVDRPAGARPVSRRAFLGAMGAVGIASAFAVGNAVKGLYIAQASEVTLTPQPEALSASDVIVEYVAPSQSVAEISPTATVSATATMTGQSTATTSAATATTTATPAEAQTASTCTVRCPRGCSYPGHCRKYTDSNGNNLCDLGECL
jgi:hypothetical protein